MAWALLLWLYVITSSRYLLVNIYSRYLLRVVSLVRETVNWSEVIVFSTGTGMKSWAAVAAYFNFYGQQDLASTIALVAGPPHAAAPHTVYRARHFHDNN